MEAISCISCVDFKSRFKLGICVFPGTRSEIAEAQAEWKAAEAELSRLAVDDPLRPDAKDKVKRAYNAYMMREAKETEYIKANRPAGW
ncbi:hypothetical protein HDU98_002184 [Podochytrium sp. JEL0797]|nr:hypothetical protein HDU98_002184 [Podochytrium sp. JEL0797]